MKKINYVILLCFFSYVNKLFSSDLSTDISIKVGIYPCDSPLTYLDVENRKLCQDLGINSNSTDLFCRVQCLLDSYYFSQVSCNSKKAEELHILSNKCDSVVALPFTSVVKSCEKSSTINDKQFQSQSLCFKKRNDLILKSQVKINDSSYNLYFFMQIDVPESVPSPEVLLSTFEIDSSSYEEDKKKLLKEDIIVSIDNVAVNEPNGYFQKPLSMELLNNFFLNGFVSMLFKIGVSCIGIVIVIYLFFRFIPSIPR